MLPTLIIEASDGTIKQTIDGDTAQRTAVRGAMDRAEVVVPRSEFDADNVDSRTDRLIIERGDGTRLFAGRFDDASPDGISTTVRVVSHERDAVDAEPTARGLTFTNVDDTTVVKDAVNGVPALSAGALETVASGLSFSFPHAARSKQIRKVAVASGAAVRYNADQTVDYQARLGSDLSLTVSPGNQNVVGDPRVTEDVRDEVTHIRGYGSREGNVTATAVASSYNGGRKVWREYEDTDIKEQSRLQAVIDRMVEEYAGEPRKLTVEATLVDVDVQRGDALTVSLPKRDIDRTMQITKLVERLTQRGQEFVATLTNRSVDQDLQGSAQESLQRFNRGYQGFLDRDQVTSGWNVAGDGQPQTLVIPAWPDDIAEEQRVELYVQGRPWRSPAALSTTSTTNSDYQSVVESASGFTNKTIDDASWTAGTSFSPSSTHAETRAMSFIKSEEGGASAVVDGRLRNTTTGDIYGPVTVNIGGTATSNEDIGPNATFSFEDPTDSSGETLQVEFQTAFGSHGVTISNYYRAIGTHTHDATLSPTITETFDGSTYYPTDVTVEVGGTTVTTIAGNNSSDWQETVDLSGQLSAGQNTITATPTGERGSLNLTLASELFRRGPTTSP